MKISKIAFIKKLLHFWQNIAFLKQKIALVCPNDN
jgi:hypothetical protein